MYVDYFCIGHRIRIKHRVVSDDFGDVCIELVNEFLLIETGNRPYLFH